MAKSVLISSVIGGTAIAALFMLSPVAAQSVSDAQIAACAQVENPLQRLVCFDQLASGQAPVVGQQTQRQQSQDPVENFGREQEVQQQNLPDRLEIEIVAKRKDAYGLWVIELSNGQRWRQTEAGSYQLPDGVDYYIERGLLNSFYLGRSDINRRIKVQRVD